MISSGWKPPALRDHLRRAARDVGQRVAAGGVRHRGGMDDAVPLAHGVDVAEVVHGLRDEVAVGEGGAFRPAGGAARVEEPGGVGGVAVGEGERVAREEGAPRRIVVGSYQVVERADLAVEAGQGLGERTVHEAGARPRVPEDVGEFAAVELRVHRYRAHVRVPAAEEGDHEFGGVGHRDPAAVARPEAEALEQGAGEPGAGVGELRIRGDGLDPAHEGRPAGVAYGGLGKERAGVHGSGLPCGVRCFGASFERIRAAPRNSAHQEQMVCPV